MNTLDQSNTVLCANPETVELLDCPVTVAELVGPVARTVVRVNRAVAKRRQNIHCRFRLLFYGPPGTGKSALAGHVCANLVGEDGEARGLLTKVNGRDIGPAFVREMARQFRTGNMFADWMVLWIEEADLCAIDVQESLLTLLDDLPAKSAVVATTNREIGKMSMRFQTRFQSHPVDALSDADIALFLTERWGDRLPGEVIGQIAAGAAGNMRAALHDAQAALDALPG